MRCAGLECAAVTREEAPRSVFDEVTPGARSAYLPGRGHAPAEGEHRAGGTWGGSTIIIGTGIEPQLNESLYRGCVSYSLNNSPRGDRQPRMKAAEWRAQSWRRGGANTRACGQGAGSRHRARDESTWSERLRPGRIKRETERLRAMAIRQGRDDPAQSRGAANGSAGVFAGGLRSLRRVRRDGHRAVATRQRAAPRSAVRHARPTSSSRHARDDRHQVSCAATRHAAQRELRQSRCAVRTRFP